MSKVIVQDAIPFVPNGGQLYVSAQDELAAVTDDEAKKLIRGGTTIRAPGAEGGSYRAVLKRLGFSYAEATGANQTELFIKVRTGWIVQKPLKPGSPVGVAYTFKTK